MFANPRQEVIVVRPLWPERRDRAGADQAIRDCSIGLEGTKYDIQTPASREPTD